MGGGAVKKPPCTLILKRYIVGGSERVMGEWLVGQWIVDIISFQEIFGLYGLKGHIVEKRYDVANTRTTDM